MTHAPNAYAVRGLNSINCYIVAPILWLHVSARF
jgi:hypothetical protein